MPDPALLDPNNRLLGWSTSDLSVYGGQPTVTLGQPRAEQAGGSFVSVPSALAEPAQLAAAPTNPSALIVPVPAILAGSDDVASSFLSPSGPPGPGSVGPIPPASSANAGPAVPDPIGSGSLAPVAIATPLAAAAQEGGESSSPANAGEVAVATASLTGAAFTPPVLDLAPAEAARDAIAALSGSAIIAPLLDASIATATGLVETAGIALDDVAAGSGTLLAGVVTSVPVETVVQTVNGFLDAPAATLAQTVDATSDATADIVAETADLAGSATQEAGAITGAVVSATAAAADSVVSTIGTSGATVVEVAGTAVAATTGIAGTALETPANVVESATAATADAAGSATGSVSAVATDAVGSVTAPVADIADAALGGSDPAGGVATLVGMVEAADAFDLSAAGATAPAVTEGGSILDALAADEASDALLGGVDQAADGLLGGGDDDHHGGGLLGGL